jgi:hypothetical protein
MKLPSIRQALQDAHRTLLRFPLVIADAAIGTAAGIILVDYEGPPQPSILFKILFAAILGIPFLTGIALTTERRQWGKPLSFTVQAIGVVLLCGYASTVPSDLANGPAIEIIRLLLLAVALHLCVAVAPWLGSKGVNGFWQYNKAFLFRFLAAILYSHILYAGLALALAALDNLFGIQIVGKRYGELWILLTGFFGTWFFLAGAPADIASFESADEYPKGLKIFSNYVLFPLVLVYLVILYAYLAKILFAWDWPQGWVSKLILGFSGAGLLSYLLLHPISDRGEQRWIKTASRWFFVVLIPLVVMLLFAVWRRVSEYGFTEGRFLAIALGIWLVPLVGYFILSSKKNIKSIPASLCIVAFLASFGPWSAFTVSERSQAERLKVLLQNRGILVDGTVRKSSTEVPVQDSREISSILSYLHDIHGFDRIQPWFAADLKDDSVKGGASYKSPPQVAALMGVEYVRVRPELSGGMVILNADREEMFNVAGYDQMLRAQQLNTPGQRRSFQGEKIAYRASGNLDTLTISVRRAAGSTDSVRIGFGKLVEKLVEEYGGGNSDRIPPGKMTVDGVADSLKVRVCLWNVRVQRQGGGSKVLSYEADILFTSH